MTINGFELVISNEYGLEFDSFLGAIYLPWHTIIIIALAVVAYKAYKIYLKRNGLVGWKY